LPKIAKLISGKTFALQGAKGNKISLTFLPDNKVIYREISQVENKFYFNTKNIPQKYQGRFCIPGMISGYWSGENTFIINNNEIGNNRDYHIEITFNENGKQAAVRIQEKTDNSQEMFKAYVINN